MQKPSSGYGVGLLLPAPGYDPTLPTALGFSSPNHIYLGNKLFPHVFCLGSKLFPHVFHQLDIHVQVYDFLLLSASGSL
jgi:hypothetical protein